MIDPFSPPVDKYHRHFMDIARYELTSGKAEDFLIGLAEVVGELDKHFREIPVDDEYYDWIVGMILVVEPYLREQGYGFFNLGTLNDYLKKVIEYPTYSGDVPCKAVRDSCVEIGLSVPCIYLRSEGYTIATTHGLGVHTALARRKALG